LRQWLKSSLARDKRRQRTQESGEHSSPGVMAHFDESYDTANRLEVVDDAAVTW